MPSPHPYCAKCGASLEEGQLVCSRCGRLTYETELNELASRARQATAIGQLQAARDIWAAALRLLPPNSNPARAVANEIVKLDSRLHPPQGKVDWKKRLGPFGAVVAFLIKFKTVLLLVLSKGTIVFNLLGFLLFYWALYGWWFAIGLVGSILMHEFGHYYVIRSYGFAAELPRFRLFGAYVRWRGGNVDPCVAANISLAGPLLGFLSGLIAYVVFLQTHRGVWLAVAQFAGWLNLMNLIPVWIFDGGSAMNAIGKQERIAIALVSALLGLILHQYLFVFVAIGTGYRIWRRDYPAQSRHAVAYYYMAVTIANGFLSWFCIQQSQMLFHREQL